MEGSKIPNGTNDSKILRFGKIIGNRLFRKNNTQSPNSNQTSETSENLIELNETINDLIQFDESQTNKIEKNLQDMLIDLGDQNLIEDTGKTLGSINREKSSNSLNSMNNIQSTTKNLSRNYIPKLSQKQFLSRIAKIDETKELIKQSKTNFIFI